MNHEDDTPLSGRLPTELAMLFGSGETYRGRQLFRWLQSGVFRFDAMSNLPGRIREFSNNAASRQAHRWTTAARMRTAASSFASAFKTVI